MYTREQMLNYHCPRWNEWPSLDLYMDQVIVLLEENVSAFYFPPPAKIVTPTMINNYVKQKIIMPSKNKRYRREHLAYLYIVFLLKPALSLADISDTVAYIKRAPSTERAYDDFCEALESALKTAFGSEGPAPGPEATEKDVLRTVTLAFSYTLLTRFCIVRDREETRDFSGNVT